MIQIEDISDITCPNCGVGESIAVSARTRCLLVMDGDGAVKQQAHCNAEIDPTCRATCGACGHSEDLEAFSHHVAVKEAAHRHWRDRAWTELNRDGELEIDDNAVVSESDDGGAYVQAWVWIEGPTCEVCRERFTVARPDSAEYVCEDCVAAIHEEDEAPASA